MREQENNEIKNEIKNETKRKLNMLNGKINDLFKKLDLISTTLEIRF